jgi:hypothetical protein
MAMSPTPGVTFLLSLAACLNLSNLHSRIHIGFVRARKTCTTSGFLSRGRDLFVSSNLGLPIRRGPLYFSQNRNKVHQQLQSLGGDHVGYGSKHFTSASGQPFSVVGVRPFTDVPPPPFSHLHRHKIASHVLHLLRADALVVLIR